MSTVQQPFPPLRLERMELRALVMPLRAGFETSFGRVGEREMVLVALGAAGLVGWGEAPVARRPHYSAETPATALHVLREHLGPAVLGRTFRSLEELRAATAWVRGHPMARAALEWAFADLGCRALGVPLAAWLGAERERVPVGVSLGIPEGGDLGRLLDEVEQRLAEGYQRVKLKVRPGFARLPLAAVRARFAALPLAADGNGAFSPAELAELQALDELGLLFLEQPLAHDDLVEHARLRRRLRTPICLDESLDGLAALDAALALGALDVVNLKSARMGGPAVALAALARCRERALPCWCGGMLETGIGRAAHVALAACPGFTQPGDLSASDRYYAEDIIEPPFRLGPDGTLAVPSGPGLGVELRQELLERRTVARELVVPAC